MDRRQRTLLRAGAALLALAALGAGANWAYRPAQAPRPAPSPSRPPAEPPPIPTREMDGVVFAYLGQPIEEGTLPDVSEGQSFQVSVSREAGQPVATRAQVDLDRDGAWDETYLYDAGVIARAVSPADDGVYTERYTWSGSAWAREPGQP